MTNGFRPKIGDFFKKNYVFVLFCFCCFFGVSAFSFFACYIINRLLKCDKQNSHVKVYETMLTLSLLANPARSLCLVDKVKFKL